MSANIVAVRGLSFRYPSSRRPVLDNIDFTLAEGETAVLLGPNGAGKSTFLLSLLGVVEASGSISLCGLELNRANLASIRRSAGLVMQDPLDQLFLPTVLDEVCFGLLQAGHGREEAIRSARALLEQMGLAHLESQHPYHLSLGEKRRLALASVLASQPRLLLLDEPSTHLDPPSRRQLIALLRDLPQSKIVVTHDMHLARRLARRAVFFETGRVVFEGAVDAAAERMQWDD